MSGANATGEGNERGMSGANARREERAGNERGISGANATGERPGPC